MSDIYPYLQWPLHSVQACYKLLSIIRVSLLLWVYICFFILEKEIKEDKITLWFLIQYCGFSLLYLEYWIAARGVALTKCFSTLFNTGKTSKFKRTKIPEKIIKSEFPDKRIYKLCPYSLQFLKKFSAVF